MSKPLAISSSGIFREINDSVDLPPILFANLPTPATAGAGALALISNVGPNGIIVRSTGSIWMPQGRQVLAAQTANTTVTGTLAETVLLTATIPGGLLHSNSHLVFSGMYGFSNNTNSKTPRLRLGGISGTAIYNPSITNNNQVHEFVRRIVFRNALDSQITFASSTASFGAPGGAAGGATSSIDFSINQEIVFSAQLTNAGDSGNLQTALLEWAA